MGSQSIPRYTSQGPWEVYFTPPGIYSSIRNRLTLQLDSEATHSLSIEFRGDLVMRRILGHLRVTFRRTVVQYAPTTIVAVDKYLVGPIFTSDGGDSVLQR